MTIEDLNCVFDSNTNIELMTRTEYLRGGGIARQFPLWCVPCEYEKTEIEYIVVEKANWLLVVTPDDID